MVMFLLSIPFGHSVHVKETHDSMDHFLSAANYQKHKWLISGDLKLFRLVLGLQGGYTKYPVYEAVRLSPNIILNKSDR